MMSRAMISPAWAQNAPAPSAPPGFDVVSLLPLILIFVIFYFLLIRPQQVKQKKHRATLAALRRGDVVVTGGGIIAKVTRLIDDHHIELEIADNLRVRVLRNTIAEVRAKTEPVGEDKSKGIAKKPEKEAGEAKT
jgi:preprotein translocase subunit YajC